MPFDLGAAGMEPTKPQISFSLLLATVGRTAEFANFLLHLDAQTYRRFELIVVDQNPDDRLLPLLAEYDRRFSIRHCRSPRGLSRARNAGLPFATGDVLAFPDDDCWYPHDLLGRVARILETDCLLDGVTGRPLDRSFSHFHTSSGLIDKQNVFLRCSSFTIFLRRQLVETVGPFDEGLGLGTETGRIAAEESDYLIRALASGFYLKYESDLQVFHKEPEVLYDAPFNRKVRAYNLALGFVLRKHRYPFLYAANTWLRAFGAMCLSAASLNLPKMRYHYNGLVGRVSGYLGIGNGSR